jgi:ankyrin repeat protein
MKFFKLFLLFLAVILVQLYADDSDVRNAINTNENEISTEASPEEKLHQSEVLQNVINNDMDGVKRAVEGGENINLVNVDGWSAARIAVQMGNLQMVRFLIENEIDLNIPDNNGISPLMIASEMGDRDMVETLLAFNANPFQESKVGTTALDASKGSNRPILPLLIAEASAVYAISHGDLEKAMFSISNGAYPDIHNNAGWTTLMLACAKGDVAVVKDLLSKKGVNVNRMESDGWSALHFAAHEGHPEIVTLLLEAGGKEGHQRTNRNGHKPIDIATERGHDAVVALLKDL